MLHLRHHDQVPGIQKVFAAEVLLLVLLGEYSNPFLDDTKKLTALDTHDVFDNSMRWRK